MLDFINQRKKYKFHFILFFLFFKNKTFFVQDDDDGWITPKNISKLKEPKVNVTEVEEKINLAVITADFAMQVNIF